MTLPDEDADRTRIRTRIEPRNEATLPAEPQPADDDSNALPAGTALGEFDIVRVIGEGGFGIVYLAFDRSLGRHVALKEYMPSSLARRIGQTTVRVKSERLRETFDAGLRSFVNEARLLAQFDHPALVKVYRFWEAGGTAYMVMPYYEGATLKQTLRQRPEPPSEAWLLGLLAPLIDALAVLHAEHCYHRDIAPDNVILLAASGAPVLLDFGAARRVIGDKTQALTVVLKSGYAPMEQYGELSTLKQGPWTDIYALGAVVHFAITGEAPQAAVSRWVDDGCVPLAQVGAGRYSAGFLAAIDRALIVKPELRTQSLAELRRDLGLVRGEAEATQRLTPPAAAHPAESRTVTWVPAAPASAPAAAAKIDRTDAAGPNTPPVPRPARAGKIAAGIGLAVLLIAAAGFYWHAATPGSPSAPQAARQDPPGPAGGQPPVSQAAPAATGPASASPPAATPLATTAPRQRLAFDQVVARQSPGSEVKLGPTKTTLRIDRDRLAFSVQSSRGGYLSLLLMGPDGSVTRVIPNQRVKSVRLQPGQALSIPQTAWGMSLLASDPPGEEHVLAIVSRTPRDFSRLGGASEGAYLVIPAPVPTEAAPADAAPPPLAGVPSCTGTGDCADEYGAAVFSVNVVR